MPQIKPPKPEPMANKEELPYSVEEICKAISQISDAMKTISRSRLKQKALIVLLANSTQLPQRIIEYVLNGLETLEATYLK